MLLESEECPKILSAIKAYQKKPSEEAHKELTETLRKQVVEHAKELMTDDQITRFVNDIPKID
jgi:DNA-binding FrmR family transcriptional regulator